METEECKELPAANCSQPENAETGNYDDATVTINSTMPEKKAAALMNLLNGDDKMDEGVKNEEVKNDKMDEVVDSTSNKGTINVTSEMMTSSMPTNVEGDSHDNMNTAVTSTISEIIGEASTTMVDEQDKAEGTGKKVKVENYKKADIVNSSSNEGKKRIVRKRKKIEEAPANDVSTSPKMVKKKMNDVKKEVRREGKPEKLEEEKGDRKNVKVVKKGEGAANKTDSIVKKKIVAKAKGGSPNTESVPSKSEIIETSASTLEKEGKKNQNIKVDENVVSAATNVKVAKKVEGAANKTIKKVKKKIATKAKGGSPNFGSTSAKSPNIETLAATLRKEENKKQNIEVDESLGSAATNIIPAAEKMDVEGKEDAEKAEVAFESKGKKNAAISSTSSTDANKLCDAEKPIPSVTEKPLKRADTAEKQLKKLDGMGLIFMCNAKTKKDCYRFNVFGLPESKKELVGKVYKGMRLFLFDVDLKLMYGIYKAASTGGYNIEPKAFDSKFPSQVRFTILRDCLPLPEEKFKAAIKENYYKRNKFNCELSAEQVKNLCKLFQSATSKASETKHRAAVDREATMPSSSTRERVQRLLRDAERGQPTNGDIYAREAYTLPRVRYPSPPPRALPPASLSRALPPPPPPSYTYERPVDDYYRRDHRRILGLEMRPRDPPIEYQDHYILYRQPALEREQIYSPSLPPAYAARLRQPGSPPKYYYRV